jgi:uncharacterized glyoxalase superfamily protein PhnB
MSNEAARSSARLNAFGIAVSDMSRSVAFYRQLGLAFDGDAENAPHAEAPLGDGVRLMIDTEEVIRSFLPDWSPGGSGRVSLAVAYDSPTEVDEAYAGLADQGFGHTEPWDTFWGQRYAIVTDPDGTHVDLYAPLPADT